MFNVVIELYHISELKSIIIYENIMEQEEVGKIQSAYS